MSQIADTGGGVNTPPPHNSDMRRVINHHALQDCSETEAAPMILEGLLKHLEAVSKDLDKRATRYARTLLPDMRKE